VRNTTDGALPAKRTGFRARRASQAGYSAVMKPPQAKFGFCLIFIFDYNNTACIRAAMGCFPYIPSRGAEACGMLGQGTFGEWICFMCKSKQSANGK
jgi:hypothetical protein